MKHHQRRHIRVPGPFDGWRVGLVSTEVRIFNLSDGGCFVETPDPPPPPSRHIVLKIALPGDGTVHLKGETVYVREGVGYAVAFVDVPAESSDRLQRCLVRLRGSLAHEGSSPSVMLPVCPRCRDSAVHPLGMAGSSLPWFSCDACEHVWAAREELPTVEIIPTADRERIPGQKRILIADDDGGVLGVLRAGLADYNLLFARDVAEASTLGRHASLDLLITDYLMPDGTGEELIAALRQTQPLLKVLILTGHQRLLDDEGFAWWTKERHLTKPCTIASIRATVVELIGAPY